MTQMLFHITTGPENPTKATLGMLVAKTAAAEGHEVDVFFAGDGVDFIREETRSAASGVGLGSAAEHWNDLVASGARMWGSGMSAKVRGVTADGPLQLVPPPKLVELIAAADQVIVY